MVEGGPWEGREAETNLILAGGDRIACDVVGREIIKSFEQWKPLKSVSPWHMPQVKRAAEIGLGARGSDEMELLSETFDNDPSFTLLMKKIRSFIG